MQTKQFKTIDEAIAAIAQYNRLLGFPDARSETDTYCEVPEITEIKNEAGEVVDSYFEIPITNELDKLLNPATIED